MAVPIVPHVRAFREQRGMSQTELGNAVGVTRQTIAAIEQRRYSPSLEVAFRIADALAEPIERLFEWEGGGETATTAAG